MSSKACYTPSTSSDVSSILPFRDYQSNSYFALICDGRRLGLTPTWKSSTRLFDVTGIRQNQLNILVTADAAIDSYGDQYNMRVTVS